MFNVTISRCFRPTVLSRGFSSLQASRAAGPRRTIRRRVVPNIPVNSTRASNKLLRSQDVPESPDAAQNESGYNSLLSPVHVPEDPGAVITERHPAAKLLQNSALVVQRRLELGNILLGFEQANKYAIMDPDGSHVGFMAEEENSFTKLLMRQWARTHRSFLTHVFDKDGVEVLQFYRPFSWINSRITAYDPVDPQSHGGTPTYVAKDQHRIVGECQQQWHLLRRKYNLFLYHGSPSDSSIPNHEPVAGGRGGLYTQFAAVDEPFLSWDFNLLSDDESPRLVGSVNRNFAGFGREIFTDTGVYALRMDAASVAAEPQHLISNTHQKHEYRTPSVKPSPKEVSGLPAAGRGMTLDERAVMLSTAVSIDFDYFSRHSAGHGDFIPGGIFGGFDEIGGGRQTRPDQHGEQPRPNQQYGDQEQPPPEYPFENVPDPYKPQQPYHAPQGQDSQGTSDGGVWFFDD